MATGLWSGISNASSILIGDSPKDRYKYINPDSDDELNEEMGRLVDDKLLKMGFSALRGNSIYCSGDYNTAWIYGDPYYIFPYDGFQFTYSTKIIDMVLDAGDYFKGEDIEDFEKMAPAAFVKKFGLKNKNLQQGIESNNEIYIHGKYIALHHESFSGISTPEFLHKNLGLNIYPPNGKWNEMYLQAISQRKAPHSEKEQLQALQSDWRSYFSIPNPSDKVTEAASYYSFGKLAKYLKKPTLEQQIAVVRGSGEALQYMQNPSEQVKLAAVLKSGRAIQFITDPSEEIQLAAINQNAQSIRYIQNPTEKVQMVILEKNPDLVKLIQAPSDFIRKKYETF